MLTVEILTQDIREMIMETTTATEYPNQETS